MDTSTTVNNPDPLPPLDAIFDFVCVGEKVVSFVGGICIFSDSFL